MISHWACSRDNSLPKSAGRLRPSGRGWIGVGRTGLDAQAANQTQVVPEPSMGEGNSGGGGPILQGGEGVHGIDGG